MAPHPSSDLRVHWTSEAVFIRTARKLLLAALVGAVVSSVSAQAQVSLKGKTVTIYVAGGVGGGVDTFARTLAPYLSKHLPGEPNVVASNMPGGGGAQAVQYLYNVAAKDGTAIGTTNVGPIGDALMSTAPLHYDLSKFRWIGSLVKGDTTCTVWHQAGIASLEDAKTREVTVTSTGVTSSPSRVALLMNALLGTRFRPITGYDGGTSLLAIERGEAAGICVTLASIRTVRPDWLRDRKLKLLVRVALTPDPEHPDVPRAFDLVKSDEHKHMLQFYTLPYEFNNPYYLPPGASGEMLATYRRAFDAAVRDPDYRADVQKRNQLIAPRDGADVTRLVQQLLQTPRAIVQKTIEATSPKR
jgi:tripartite-type tricarboxylate transporter receptor subunit TctC